MKTKTLLITFAMAAVTAVTARADINLDINVVGDIRLGRRPPPPPPAVVVVSEDAAPKGPAPWEHGRWYQHNQNYYYYPGDNVYYRASDHTWFYQERGEWRSARNLPESVRIDFNRSVSLTMATDRPYEYHQQIVSRYPANYFGTRVRLRDEERHDDRGRDNHDNDKPGPGRDDHGPDRDNNGHDKSRDHDDRR